MKKFISVVMLIIFVGAYCNTPLHAAPDDVLRQQQENAETKRTLASALGAEVRANMAGNVSDYQQQNKRDYYEALGVPRYASPSEIKQAYRRLAKITHPDAKIGESKQKQKESEEYFKEIAEAYAVLSDPDRRQQYDEFRSGEYSGIHGYSDTIVKPEDMVLTTRSQVIYSLIRSLDTWRDKERNAIKEKLLIFGEEDVVDALIVALKDRKSFVRTNAATILGKIGNPKAIVPLINLLKYAEDILSRYDGAQAALVKFGESAKPLLVEELKSDVEFFRKIAAETLTLMNLPENEWLDIWHDVLHSDNIPAVYEAVTKLGIIADPSSIEPLKNILESEVLNVGPKSFYYHYCEQVRYQIGLALERIDANGVASPVVFVTDSADAGGKNQRTYLTEV